MAAASPVLSLIALGLALVGLGGAFTGIISPMAGFQTFLAGALLGGLFCTILALIGLFLTRGGADPAGRTKALTGLAIAMALLIAVLAAASNGGDVPPINDITTDLDNPPSFATSSVTDEYDGRDMSYPADFVAVVRESYPEITPIQISAPPSDALVRVEQAAQALGWEIVAREDSAGKFYAKESSSIFRFVDDVVVRVRAQGSGTRVDVRSKSRDGRSDLGANAARIQRLADALRG